MKIGYIYKICNKNSDKIYIGSTVKEIEERLIQHKHCYKRYLNNKYSYNTSFEIINDQTCFVELLAEVYFDDKHELHKKEKIFIQMYSDICVNKNIPTRTIKEYCQDNKEKLKEYREDNKDKTKEYFKEYWQENKEKINEQKKKYYQQNKDKINEKKKHYQQQNKEKINEKIYCNICNKLVGKRYMKNHQKRSICIKKDSQNTNNNINNKTFKIKIKKNK